MSDGPCILVCRECDNAVLPFNSYRDRGKWATEHRSGTGHGRWYCLDGWPSPHEVLAQMAASDEFAARLRGDGRA